MPRELGRTANFTYNTMKEACTFLDNVRAFELESGPLDDSEQEFVFETTIQLLDTYPTYAILPEAWEIVLEKLDMLVALDYDS